MKKLKSEKAGRLNELLSSAAVGGSALASKLQNIPKHAIFRFSVVVFLLTFAGCGPNQRILESANTPTPSNVQTPGANTSEPAGTFEQDLTAMRNADFNFIHVFRRKDGGVLDAEDKALLNANTPPEVNRRRLSDGGKALIMGSNFRLPPDKIKLLAERFAFEDYSKPESEIMTNANTGGNTNAVR